VAKTKSLILFLIFVLIVGTLTACFNTQNEKPDKVTDVIIASSSREFEYMALFATSRTEAKTSLSCKTTGSASMDYYVSGLAAGKWKVEVNDKTVGTFEATEEGGLLTFEAPAGTVTISPV
jgi:hypothetical protein